MNNRLPRPQNIEQYLKVWIYLLPIVGTIPAVWTIYKTRNTNLNEHREQKKASHLSVRLALAWLISYSCLSLGAAGASELISFRLLYANAIFTSAYFIICTVMTIRLSNKS